MEQADSKQGLSPFGGSFQASSKPSRRRAEHGTFTRAARVTKELVPATYNCAAPEFHTQHNSFVWQHSSVSKKGYTAGFVSQTPRLGTSFRYTGPGPGTVAVSLAGHDRIYTSDMYPKQRLLQAHTKRQAGVTNFTARLELAQFQGLHQHRQVASPCIYSTGQKPTVRTMPERSHG